MSDVPRGLAAMLPWFIWGGVSIAGLFALAPLAQGQVGGRSDRRSALHLAGGLAAMASIVLLQLVLGSGLVPRAGAGALVFAAVLASVAGITTFFAAVLGYVLLARARPLRLAFAAEILLPLAIGLLILATIAR